MSGLSFMRARGAPRFAAGRVGFAIGDVHGRADLLERMLERISDLSQRAGAGRPIVIFLGDYIDRGPESRAVVDLILGPRLAHCELRCLKGNHEAAMLDFLEQPLKHRAWLGHGGLETLVSYGVYPLPSLGARSADIEAAAASLRRAMPPSHRAFFAGLERYVVYGDYAFVHAGVDAERPLDAQSDSDLFWSRQRFLESDKAASHVIVHGHTPCAEPYRDQRRIGLDTGAYFSGRLSAVELEGEGVSFITVC